MKTCKHNIPESLHGAGACAIRAEVKLRNGKPKWWCHTHGLAAGAPDGVALEQCPGAWFKPIQDDMRLELDLADGEIAVWGALAPALTHGDVPDEPGKVHVHRRRVAGASKDIDRSFDIVVLRNGAREVTVEGMAAVAYSVSELAGRDMTTLTCPHCGGKHIDEKMFATRAHSKHQCNACGRNFNDRTGPSVGNPLADASGTLALPPVPKPQPADRSIEIRVGGYSGIAMWPSNSAIVSTMRRAEEEGVHVHAWQDGRLVIDETYGTVVLDGERIDKDDLRALAVQRALAEGAPIVAVACKACGNSFVSPSTGWIEPRTSHECTSCRSITKTRRKSFVNPLAGK